MAAKPSHPKTPTITTTTTTTTPPNLKTWVLKTSIHCEGCKKKVMKIIQNIPGVCDSDVDLKLQKVTVTGNFDVNALIAKLIKKTGKQVEIWPEVKTEVQLQKKQSKPKPKEKPQQLDAQKVDITPSPEEAKKTNGDGELQNVKLETKTSVKGSPEQSKKEAVKQKQRESDKSSAVDQVNPHLEKKSVEDVASKDAGDVKQGTVEVKANAAADGEAVGEKEDGVVGKKKKKKGQNSKQKSKPNEGLDDSSTEAPAEQQYYTPNHSPTRHYPGHTYGLTSTYHAPPVYTVNYNTTPYLTSSYKASYYASPPSHTEAYAYSGSSTAQFQPSDITSYQSQPSDSFQIFSDENPNACSLM